MVQSVYGAWAAEQSTAGDAAVFVDTPFSAGNSNGADKSPGLVRVSPVSLGPTLTQRWSLLGWSIRLGLVYAVPVGPNLLPTYHARMGTLWGGLAIDSQQVSQGGVSLLSPFPTFPGRAQFPPDLSTFDVLWTQEDDVAIVVNYNPGNNPLPAGAVPSLIAKTFMFPAPITAQPGTQLQMQLILTPGLYYFNAFVCTSASWSLIYDDAQGSPR